MKELVVCLLVVGALFGLCTAGCVIETVPQGHVAVRTTFGEVSPTVYTEGLHFPVNPMSNWTHFDCRQRTHQETVSVPSRDEQTTSVDLSIQYRIDGSKAAIALKETGGAEQLVTVHMVPYARSISRQVGKTVKQAEDFFDAETHTKLQLEITTLMRAACAPNGLIIDQVLIRDVTLPAHIVKAIESKKVREQLAQEQQAELDRYDIEQKQKVSSANAELDAAKSEAEQRRLLADAKAYEIEAINKAVADNPAFVQLEAIRALTEMSKDPAAKMYFMDGDVKSPIPFVNLQ